MILIDTLDKETNCLEHSKAEILSESTKEKLVKLVMQL